MQLFENSRKAKLYSKISWSIVLALLILINYSMFLGDFDLTFNGEKLEPSFSVAVVINLIFLVMGFASMVIIHIVYGPKKN